MTSAAVPERAHTSGYVPCIDGLRAVAILAVMLYHLVPWTLPGGFAGVDIFFVISGYVVSASLARDADQPFGRFLVRFYARRVVRIVPPLIACLVIVSVAATLVIPNAWLSNTSQWTALFAYIGLGNAGMVWFADGYFSPRVEFNPYVHTWSLGVEEQFYALFPLVFLVWVAGRRRTDALRNAGTWLLAGLLVLSVVYAWRHAAIAPERAFYLLPGRFWELASGGLLFQLQQRRSVAPGSARAASALLWIGAGLVAIGVTLSRAKGYPFPWALTSVAGSVLLIHGVTSPAAERVVISRLLGSGPFVAIGKLSYSLYLWHWPVNVLYRWTVGLDGPVLAASAVATTVALSLASYRLVENPVRHSARVRAHAPARVVAGGVAVIATCALLTINVFAFRDRISLSVTTDTESWYPDAPAPLAARGATRCRAQAGSTVVTGLEVRTIAANDCAAPGAASYRLFMIGDSHALAYQPMLHKVAAELGVPTRLYSNGGCSFANMHKATDPKWAACAAYYRAAIADINALATPRDVVLLAGLRLNRIGDQWGRVREAAGYAVPNSAAAVAQLADAMRETEGQVAALSASGARIIIDSPVPIFGAPAFRCSDWFNRGNSICAGGLTIARDSMEALRRPVVDSLVALARRNPRVAVWDPFAALCGGTVCRAADERGPLYFDGDHLSGIGNRVIYPSFAVLLSKIQ